MVVDFRVGKASKKFRLFALLVGITIVSNNVLAVDYTARQSGNWNGYGVWQRNRNITPSNNDNATINRNYTITVNTTANIGKVTLSAGTLNVNYPLSASGAFAISGGTMNVNNAITANGSFTCSGGTININSGNLTANGDFTYSGGNISITDGYKVILKGNLIVNSDLTIDNHYDISNVTGIQVANGKTLTINSDLELNQSVTLSGNIAVTSGNTLTISSSQVNFNNASFDDSEGTIHINNDVTIRNLTKCVGGNLTFSQTHRVTYDATCTYMLSGEHYNVSLNTSAGSNISLCSDVTINGTLNWAYASRIVLNGNTLALCNQPTGNTAFSTSHMFVAGGNGALKFFNPTATTITNPITMPLGTYNSTAGYEYSPVTFASGVSSPTGSYVAVQVMDTALSSRATDLERYWTITTSGLTVSNATLKFNYVDVDDAFSYADQWTVYHNDTEIDESNTDITNKVITITNVADIAGVWEAKGPEPVTLYTHQSGAWNDVNTWTTDPTGKTVIDAAVPTAANDVVILNGKTVNANGSVMYANTVKIGSGGTLDMEDLAASHEFENLYGQGTLRIEGDFPTTGNYSLFVSADGGTTEFYGAHSNNAIPSQYTYNNLILNYDNNVHRTLNQDLKINGKLTLTKGSLEFTATNQKIDVNGDIYIAANGGIYVYIAGNKTSADSIVVGGNFTNYGTVSMTYRTYAGYTQTQATSDEGTNGRGIIRFVNSNNAYFRCYNTTNLSQLIVDKGSDQTYVVTLYSDAYEHFGLLGRASEAGNGFNDQDNPPQVLKPLWLKNGTLELTGYVYFKSLSENGSDKFIIPLNGCLYLNGENVKVDVCFSGYSYDKGLMPAGKLQIDAGTFDCKTGGGVIFRNTSEIVINGGSLRAAQFRPSNRVDGGKTTFIMNGGEASFDGQGYMHTSGLPTFYMPFDSYTFIMTGGALNICSSTNNGGGAFVVNCNPENSKVIGGEITIYTKPAYNANSTTYNMICRIPLYNLTLKNDDNYAYTHSYTDFSGRINGKNVTVTADKLYVTNNLTIGNHVTLNTNNKSIEVGGDLIIESGSTVNLGTGDVMLNGGGASIQQFTSEGTINCGSSNTTSGYYTLTIDENSDVQINNDITVNSTFTLDEGAIMRDGAANTYTLKSNAVISGTHYKPASGAGTVVFTGASPTISGTGSGSLNNVNVNLSSGNLALTANLGITGNLRLISTSLFNIAGNHLSLGEDAAIYTDAATSTNFSNTKMILTNGVASADGVSKTYSPTNNSFTFPFGILHSGIYYYLPATINYTSATTYGTVTSRPVDGAHPLIGDASAALACYWITAENDFDGVEAGDIGQAYYYNDNFVSGTIGNYVPAQYNNATWTQLTTGSMHAASNYFEYNSAASANGHYTCGDPGTSFADILKLYSSSYVTNNTGTWRDPRSWSIDEVGGEPNYYDGSKYYKYVAANDYYKEYDHETGELIESGDVITDYSGLPYPVSTTAVYIGSEDYQHTIVMTENGNACANLRIHPGSTLDLSTYTGHTFSLVEVDETAEEGAGTLKISSTAETASFPSGDFVKFLGEHGGTVHYYGNHKDYYIPSTSESGLSLANYCNLIVGGTAFNYRIRIPTTIDLTIYKNLTASGWMHSAYTVASHTVTIYGNFNVEANSNVYIREAGYNKAQNYIIYGDLNIEESSKFYVSGHSQVTHNLKIAGSIIANGNLDLTDSNGTNDFRITTTFFGTDTSYIKGNGNIEFYTLICDKGTDATPMLIMQNNATSEHDDDEPFLTLLNGTFQVDIEDGNTLELTRKCDLTIATTAALSVKSGTVQVANYNDYYNLYLNGSLEVQGGTLNIGNSSYSTTNSIIYSATSTPLITISGGELNVNGLIRRSNGTRYGRLSYRQTGGDVLIRGNNRTNTTYTPDGNALFEILNDDSEFTTLGGTITTTNGNGGETFGDILIRPATTSCTGGEIIIDGNTNQKILSSATLYNITIKEGSTLTVYSNPINAYNITIEEDASFISNGYDLTIRHGIYNANTDATKGVNSGGLQVGSATQTTYFASNGMEISGVSGNITNFANVVISGSLNLANENSDIAVNKNLTLTTGIVNDNGSTIYLLGNLENYGTFTSSETTGGISFDGTDEEQYIIGIGTGVLGSVIVNNTHNVYLNCNTTIENILTLNSILYADVNLLTLGKNATVTASTFDDSHMILLNGAQEDNGVKKIFASGASDFTFPIGITANYTPARYVFTTNNIDGASITVKPINYLNKDISIAPTCYLDYFWNVKTEGFDENNDSDADENPNFSVTQIYTYTDGKFVTTNAETYTESSMLPEYLRTVVDYQWLDVTSTSALDVDANTITFNPMGHIEGEYTAGAVIDAIYTALPILYSNGNGNWSDRTTWWTTPTGCPDDDDNCYGGYYNTTPAGNPAVIQSGHTVTVTADETKSYCLTFTDVTSVLNLGTTSGNDFGRVYGAGKMKMDATSSHDFMFPAGDFSEFLNTSTSIIEFGGDNYGTLPTSPGSPSHPLQNVILSGTGIKYLPSGTAEQINGSLTIENSTTLNNSKNNLNIIIKGDWIDENSTSTGFVPSTSSVTFAGETTQNIKLSNNATTFYNLVINNSGDDGVVVTDGDNGFSVSNCLTLTNGYVYTDESHLLTLSAATTNYSGGSSNSFVDGPMGRYIAANGNAKFPIGNAERYALTPISNVSTAGIWVIKYHNNDPDNDNYYTDDEHLTAPLTSVSDNEYWEIYLTGNSAATATVNLRYDANSYSEVNTTSKLAKLTIVNYTSDTWSQVESARTSSSTTTSGNILSSSVQTVYGKQYTFGYVGTTAKINTDETDEYYVCDGTSTISIPVVLTGTSPYTLQYSITNGDATTTNTISAITSDTYNITLSGTNLGGYNATPYTISLVSVSDASEDGIVSGDNVTVQVWYNEAPVITGDATVGQTDTRTYTMTSDSDWEKLYAWTWSGGTTGATSVKFSNTTTAETDITFCRNNTTTGTTIGEYTLTATKTYKTTDASKTCTNSTTKTITIEAHPVPDIISDNTTFTACYGTTHTYYTTEVSGHTYSWTVIGGTIISGQNTYSITVTWGDSGSGTISVTETNTSNHLTGTDSETMYFYDAVSIADDDVSTNDVCSGTRASVSIASTSSALQYMVYNSDDNTIYSNYQAGNGSTLSINTTALTADVNIKVIAKNDGCSATTSAKEIGVLENPAISINSISNLYIGAPAKIEYTQTSTVDPAQYSFDFTSDTYNDIAASAITSPISIAIPASASSLTGTLRVIENTTANNCYTDYDIDKTISQDYLWSGNLSTVWDNADNWYSATVPTTSNNVIINAEATNMPDINVAANAADINISSEARITLTSNTLTIAGNLNNEGSLSATNGTIAFTNGEHNVTGSNTFANISNSGTVNFNSETNVTGNISNSGTFSGSAITLNGENAQTIGGGSFGSLTFNNSEGVTVSESINIADALTLTNGIVTVAGNQVVALSESASASSASVTTFVDGKMQKTGNTSFTFPIGNNGKRAMLGVEPVGASADAVFTAQYTYNSEQKALTSEDANMDSELKRVSQMETWAVTGTANSYLTLYFDNGSESEITDLEYLTIAHYNSSESRWEDVGNSKGGDATTGWAKTKLMTSYSPFTFGSTNEDEEINPLPVEVVNFNGYQQDNTIILTWTTMSETNNDYFEILRSTDGINFATIGFIDGNGNSNNSINYQFTDNAPEQGVLYYQLKQVDIDGVSSYADKLICIQYTNENLNVSINPNPTNGLFTLTSNGLGQMLIMTQGGNIVRKIEITDYIQHLDISDLSNGVYIAKFISNGEISIYKIVKF